MLKLSRRTFKSGRPITRLTCIAGMVAGACLINSQAPNAYAHNLATNGTFDTSLNGWSITTIPEIGRFTWDIFGHPGGSARGDKVSGPGSALYSRILGQQISTIPGEDYDIAFQLYNPYPGLDFIEARFGSNSIVATTGPFPGWEVYSFTGKATGSRTFLTFSYAGLYGAVYIDNVSVRAYVEPAVPGPPPLLGLGAAYGYSRRLRKRIKLNSTAKDLSGIG